MQSHKARRKRSARKGRSAQFGRTSEGRLQLLDSFLELLWRADDFRISGALIDLGFGASPVTSLALLDLAHKHQPDEAPELLALDVDPLRVQSAQEQYAARAAARPQEQVSFACGGFDLLGRQTPAASVIRVMNVLRGYGALTSARVQFQLARHLLDGALLLEGTSDQFGKLLTSHIWKRQGRSLVYGGLLLALRGEQHFGPLKWRDYLPRDLRRRSGGEEPIFLALSSLQEEFDKARPKRSSPTFPALARIFEEASANLAPSMSLQLLKHSQEEILLLWSPTRPSLRPEVLAPGPCDFFHASSS